MRFRKVVDVRLLEIELDNIFIKGRKIHANVLRFQRGMVGVVNKEKKVWTHVEVGNQQREMHEYHQGREGRVQKKGGEKLYGQVVKNQGQNHSDQGIKKDGGWILGNRKPVFSHVHFNMEKEDMKRFELAYVGVMEKHGMTYNVQESLYKEGYSGIKATPLGANLCLLEEEEVGEIGAMVRESEKWAKAWFADIHPW